MSEDRINGSDQVPSFEFRAFAAPERLSPRRSLRRSLGRPRRRVPGSGFRHCRLPMAVCQLFVGRHRGVVQCAIRGGLARNRLDQDQVGSAREETLAPPSRGRWPHLSVGSRGRSPHRSTRNSELETRNSKPRRPGLSRLFPNQAASNPIQEKRTQSSTIQVDQARSTPIKENETGGGA